MDIMSNLTAAYVLYACFAAQPLCEMPSHHIEWRTYTSATAAETCAATARHMNETPMGKAFPFHCIPAALLAYE